MTCYEVIQQIFTRVGFLIIFVIVIMWWTFR